MCLAQLGHFSMRAKYASVTSTGDSSPPATAPVTVAIQVLQFVPQEITVPVGTRVAWVNDGGRHQIVADDDSFKSPQLTIAQQKFVYQFRSPGVFPYHCFFHGGAGGKGMAGVVTVVERTP